MTDIAKGMPTEVYVFAQTEEGAQVSTFSTESGLELEQLLNAPDLSILPEDMREEVEKFISHPHETLLPTW